MTTLEQLIANVDEDDSIRILSEEETQNIYKSHVKLKMLDKLETETIRSMRHLARRCNSDKSTVRKHLREFEDQGIITIEQSKFKGARALRPRLNYDVIIPHPRTRRQPDPGASRISHAQMD